ncbi:glycosyltransferase [Flavobacterium sp. GT3R68]|uniref:glycosyltransferase n=1 Tax=Flavobacterium sp. GT3R68 TaxID=2594437 RepID=UPI000F8850D2|nr:glycosyltransferase [Flavobacterium sp. GT3R68]RTY92303.1 glycosyltransferase [Flavobacterium sp. GSN2]TRW92539.1 glycosyltransferase [Flavobacterium sp. GT3R68]
MKKNILFVIPSLGAGGAEKSLINLLSQFDFKKFNVDLFLFNNSGIFLNSLPKEVTIIQHEKSFATFNEGLVKSCLHYFFKAKFSLLISRIQFFFANRIKKDKAISEQKSWKYISKSIRPLEKKYDCAIGYLEKSSLYFVVDKVNSSNKIGWIHTNYSTSGMNPAFDTFYFNNLQHLVTVSEECAKSLNLYFPAIDAKIAVIENIVSPQIINSLSILEKENKFDEESINILTIARLSKEKGIDLAIEACSILMKNNSKIKWYVIGDGPERDALTQKIKEYQLQESFLLMGLKENPYGYLKQSDVYVQPSRYEGKSIAVDEAKILKKPIIVTNFSTAKDQINTGENGLITEMNPISIAESILTLIQNQKLIGKFALNLSNEKIGTEEEIYKLYDLIDEPN